MFDARQVASSRPRNLGDDLPARTSRPAGTADPKRRFAGLALVACAVAAPAGPALLTATWVPVAEAAALKAKVQVRGIPRKLVAGQRIKVQGIPRKLVAGQRIKVRVTVAGTRARRVTLWLSHDSRLDRRDLRLG
jgi:hypothetical protein